jgi:hypothetical protein
MNKIYLRDDVVLYEGFLTPEECRKTLEVLHKEDKRQTDFWKAISFYESYSSGYPEDGDALLEEVGLPSNWFSSIRNRMREAAADIAKKSPEEMGNISFHSQRWLPGAFAPFHSDNSDEHGKMGAFTRSRYAGFLYLNDDFEGGELVFKNLDNDELMTVQPTLGTFAIFHGGHRNMHKVEIVKRNPRYTLGSFWDDRQESDYSEEERAAWAAELAETRAQQKIQQGEWQDVRDQGLRLSPYGTTYPAEEA